MTGPPSTTENALPWSLAARQSIRLKRQETGNWITHYDNTKCWFIFTRNTSIIHDNVHDAQLTQTSNTAGSTKIEEKRSWFLIICLRPEKFLFLCSRVHLHIPICPENFKALLHVLNFPTKGLLSEIEHKVIAQTIEIFSTWKKFKGDFKFWNRTHFCFTRTVNRSGRQAVRIPKLYDRDPLQSFRYIYFE